MPLFVEALEDEQTAAHRLTVARQTRPDHPRRGHPVRKRSQTLEEDRQPTGSKDAALSHSAAIVETTHIATELWRAFHGLRTRQRRTPKQSRLQTLRSGLDDHQRNYQQELRTAKHGTCPTCRHPVHVVRGKIMPPFAVWVRSQVARGR